LRRPRADDTGELQGRFNQGRQQKTGAELWMRQHKDLIAELASVQHLSLLTTAKNAAFDSDSLRPASASIRAAVLRNP